MRIDLETVLTGNHEAVDELLAAADACAAVWTTPAAPGKWSPSQLVEHVARALEESAHVAAGEPSTFPTFPAFLRPVARGLFFKRVLRKGAFPKAKTTGKMNPASGPATPRAGRVRLEDAVSRFDRACRARAAAGDPVDSSIFGRVSVADYARFQELHTRHHRRQLPDAT